MEDSSSGQLSLSPHQSRRLKSSAISESLPVLKGTVNYSWRKHAENISAFSPGQALADGLKNNKRDFLGPLPLLSSAPFSLRLAWVGSLGK